MLHRGPDLLQRDARVEQPLDHLEHEDVTEAVQPLRAGPVGGADARLDQPGTGPVVELAVGDAGGGAGGRPPVPDLAGLARRPDRDRPDCSGAPGRPGTSLSSNRVPCEPSSPLVTATPTSTGADYPRYSHRKPTRAAASTTTHGASRHSGGPGGHSGRDTGTQPVRWPGRSPRARWCRGTPGTSRLPFRCLPAPPGWPRPPRPGFPRWRRSARRCAAPARSSRTAAR